MCGDSQIRSYIRWIARAKLVAEKSVISEPDQPGLGAHLVGVDLALDLAVARLPEAGGRARTSRPPPR